MISDISKSIKATLYERISSPLFGSFLISWILWNYKTILIIVSSLDVKEKISYIEKCIYNDFPTLLLQGFVGPLVSAVLFIIIYPFPAKWIYKYWSKRQKELKEIKQEIEDETPLTLEESREIRREFLNLESEYDSELEKKIIEIDRLKTLIKEHEKNLQPQQPKSGKALEPLVKKDKSKLDALTAEQEDIMTLFSKSGGVIYEDIYLHESKFDKVKAEYLMEELAIKGFVTNEFDGNGTYFELTNKGKQYLVRKGIAT